LPDQHTDHNVTRASARLPGLDIEIVHRRSPDAEAEQISINLQAVPSFEAFGRHLEAVNPFALWLQAAQLAWLPWLGLARSLALPGNTPATPRLGADASRATLEK
jgi:hypothetical protein